MTHKIKFELHWKHGEIDVISGSDIVNAMNSNGIGAGALRALDYYKEVIEEIEILD